MKKLTSKIFNYISPLWCGADGKISLRACLAILFSIDFVRNLSFAIWRWTADRSMEGLSLVLGIEASLIVSLLGITAIQNISQAKIDASVNKASDSDAPPV